MRLLVRVKCKIIAEQRRGQKGRLKEGEMRLLLACHARSQFPSWIQCDMHEGIEDLTFETTEIADSCPFSSKLVSLYAACTFSEKIILSSDPSFLFAEDSSSFC